MSSPIRGFGYAGGQAFPLTPRPASGFGDAIRSQVRSEAARALATGFGTTQRAASSASTASRQSQGSQASQRSVSSTTHTASAPTLQLQTTGEWAELARSIGGNYLSPGMTDVFVRQMALESANFDPDVIAGRRVSSAGAEGIAQLMPSSYPNVNRRDPVASLHAAAQTMRDNLTLFNGDPRKALAAYNAGAGRVGSEVRNRGTGWENGLPAETQTYLAALMGRTA